MKCRSDYKHVKLTFDSKGDVVSRRRYWNDKDESLAQLRVFSCYNAHILGERCYHLDNGDNDHWYSNNNNN